LGQIEVNKALLLELKEGDLNSYDEISKIITYLKAPPERIRKQTIIPSRKESIRVEPKKEGKEVEMFQKLDTTNEFFEDFGFQRKKVEEKNARKSKKG